MDKFLSSRLNSMTESIGILIAIQDEDLYRQARENPPEEWKRKLMKIDALLNTLVDEWKAKNTPTPKQGDVKDGGPK